MEKLGRLPPVVGFYASQEGSGKSTAAKTLETEAGYWPISFADPVKQLASQFIEFAGIPWKEADRYVYEDKHKVVPGINKTGREILETLGTAWGRNCISRDVWVGMAKREIERSVDSGCPVVIDDIRFPEELELIRLEFGGVAIKVENPRVPHRTSIAEGLLDGRNFNATIINDGSEEELKAQTLEILQKV